MMIELQCENFGTVDSFFEQKKQYIPALSVIHGNYPGRVFVDNEQAPHVAIVWVISRWLYIEGGVTTEDSREAVYRFIKKVVLSDCELRNVNGFEIYSSESRQWDDLFLDGIEHVKVDKHYESVYTLNIDQFKRAKAMLKMTEDTLQINQTDSYIIPDSYYASPYVKDRFKRMKSVGVEIRKDDQLVSMCSNNGLYHGNEYFVDVDTYEVEERGKGYATLASMNLIDFLLDQGMNPLWETTHSNIASHKIATKLGFEVMNSYPVYAFVIADQKEIELELRAIHDE